MTPRAPYRSAPFSPFAAKLLLLVTVPLPLAPGAAVTSIKPHRAIWSSGVSIRFGFRAPR